MHDGDPKVPVVHVLKPTESDRRTDSGALGGLLGRSPLRGLLGRSPLRGLLGRSSLRGLLGRSPLLCNYHVCTSLEGSSLTRGEACEPPTTCVIGSRIAAPVLQPGAQWNVDADRVSLDMTLTLRGPQSQRRVVS